MEEKDLLHEEVIGDVDALEEVASEDSEELVTEEAAAYRRLDELAVSIREFIENQREEIKGNEAMMGAVMLKPDASELAVQRTEGFLKFLNDTNVKIESEIAQFSSRLKLIDELLELLRKPEVMEAYLIMQELNS